MTSVNSPKEGVLNWVIVVAGYGSFIFEGTEAEAEDMRKHKANWEGGIAKKRPADACDIPQPSDCWNHPGFRNRGRYADCPCGECNDR